MSRQSLADLSLLVRVYHALCTGSYDWLVRADLTSLPKTLDRLIGTMSGWDEWLPSIKKSWKAKVLLQACAFGICNIAVIRKHVLSPDPRGAEVTLQQLEADGVIELRPAGMASGVRLMNGNGGDRWAKLKSKLVLRPFGADYVC